MRFKDIHIVRKLNAPYSPRVIEVVDLIVRAAENNNLTRAESISTTTLVIAVGGDGTMLEAMRLAQPAGARDANRATWAAANLSAGMIVKMAGTRDGVGVRYVVALQDGQVVCRKCAPVWRNDIESFRRSYPSNEVFMLKTKTREVVNNWYVEHDVTTHAMEKVAGLFVKNDKGVYTLQGID